MLESMNFTWSPEVIKTLLLVSVTLLIAVVVNVILRSLIRIPHSFDTRRARTYVTILRNFVTIIVYAVAFYVILSELGINITPLLASAGIVGLIIGLGAKSLIEDLIGGLFLLSQDSIAIGDSVKIDDAEGWIEKIGFRTLTIRSRDGALSIIPNGQIKKVMNFSRHKTRLPLEIPVKGDQAIETVLKAANEALTHLEKDQQIANMLLPGSTIDGIEDFKPDGHIMLRATLHMSYEHRLDVARRFRYFVKKAFEKHKLNLN
jgi:moderate conductance mechanosensitive channel